MAQLQMEFLEAMRGPVRMVVRPPGGFPVPEDVVRRWQRFEPTGRMREHLRRQLFAANTPESVVAAVEAAYRPLVRMSGVVR